MIFGSESLCRTKEERDLKIKDIGKFNKSLFAKWRWRMMDETKGK